MGWILPRGPDLPVLALGRLHAGWEAWKAGRSCGMVRRKAQPTKQLG
jgi:hypothetical protein